MAMGSFFQKALKVLKAAALINGILLFMLAASLAIAFSLRSLTADNDASGKQPAAKPEESRFDKMTPDQTFASAQQVAAIALGDGEYFANAQTAEEAFPGVYSSAHVPPYWITTEKDFKLAKRLGLATLPSLPSYDSLTRSERLTLCCITEKGEMYTQFRADIRSLFGGMLYDRKPLFAGQHHPEYFIRKLNELPKLVADDPEALTKKEALEWLDDFYPALILSPITNSIMRLDRKEFTPGQAYVEYHYKDATWEKLWPNYIVQPGEYSPDELINTGFIYYRVYGEKAVIAEGLYADTYAGHRYRIALAAEAQKEKAK